MENEEIQAQDDVVEQEEQTSPEDEQDLEEETVTIPKAKFTKMQRKAQAYDATKSRPAEKPIINRSDEKWKERLELKVEGHDEQAIDFIQKNGGKKALENPYIVKALEAMKEQKIADKATVEEGSKSQTEKRFNARDFAKLPHSEQLKVMSELN